jgi:micrococcal nuclease
MLARRKRLIFSLVIFLILVAYQNFGNLNMEEEKSVSEEKPEKKISQSKKEEAQVIRVIDGDTIEVLLNDKKERVRIIGIDAPETVDPRQAVECFGKEASNFAKTFLNVETVLLESDPTQDDKDVYGRLLRYVFVNEGVDFGKLMITQGYAHEYTYDLPYKYQKEYVASEKRANEEKIGLWDISVCPVKSS